MKPKYECAICDERHTALVATRDFLICKSCYARFKWFLKHQTRIQYLLEDKENRWH